jgi:D-alanyl-D-alanine carboxypeptidase/D-alanyl-D-alanine-endopeptidase (penicillin-binding protein 4)
LKKAIFLLLLLSTSGIYSQKINSVFNTAFTKFAGDPDFKHATISLFVVNTTTGKNVTEVNTQIGLAPASCQKVITASTAYELLGNDFSYKTSLSFTGKIENGVLNGDIIIKGSGDPTLGSWRYKQATEENIISAFTSAISRAGIHEIKGNVIADESAWAGEVTPDGWIWQDIGNYYGAGASALNWRENQYDLLLKSGNKINDPVEVAGTIPSFVEGLNLRSMATSAEKGSGDNSYIYFPLNENYGYVRGTIPLNENKFKISGAMPHPAKQLAITLESALKKTNVKTINNNYPSDKKIPNASTIFYTYNSPPLDSINYWFLKKSINLYGEALLKTLGYQFAKSGSTDSGVNIIKRFWQKKGIEPYALNILDGSGLSPGNRITTDDLVQIMQYAKKQKWFASFYNALPEINGIKMKSGSINGVISYTGFMKSKSGDEYTFAFIVNNYNGGGNSVKRKMWKLLDVLK